MGPAGKITQRGVEELYVDLKAMRHDMEDLRKVEKEFVKHTEKRITNMMHNGGRVMGPWGKGYKPWAPNTPWVRREKADRRVFYKHQRSKSSIEEAFNVHASSRRSELIIWSICEHPAADYIQAGYPRKVIRAKGAGYLRIPMGFGQFMYRKQVTIGPMKPRPLDGFREGDEKKMIDLLFKHIVRRVA